MDSGIVGVLGTVLGVLLGGPVTYYYAKVLVQTTHRNAIELLRQQDFSNSCFFFINAFMDELNLLELTSKDAYVDILRPAFPKHKTAVYIFRQAIHDEAKRIAFDKTWEEYYKNENQPISPLRQYSTQLPQSDGMPHEKRRPLAIAGIKALLKFTEEK